MIDFLLTNAKSILALSLSVIVWCGIATYAFCVWDTWRNYKSGN